MTEPRIPRRARIVGTTAARGGGGASVLAVALAVAARRRHLATLLLDVDPLGGGLDLVLGAEDQPGLRWLDLGALRGRLPPDLLVGGLPTAGGLPFLSWDRSPAGRGSPDAVPVEAVEAVVEGARGQVDLVVADLPRRLTPQSRAVAARCDEVFLVVPREVRAVAAARAVLEPLRDLGADVRLVVRGPAPGGLSVACVADGIELPLAAAMRAEPGLAAALDRGRPPATDRRSPLRVAAEILLDGLELGVREAFHGAA